MAFASQKWDELALSEGDSSAVTFNCFTDATSKNLLSLGQSEVLNSEDIVAESDSGQLLSECEINEEMSEDNEATDGAGSHDSELRDHFEKIVTDIFKKMTMNELKLLISKTLSRSFMVDLLKDFIGSEYFLIDGDSLLLSCAWNFTLKDLQTLHFFYLVEIFLHDFIQKEAKFAVVFFWDTSYFYWLFPELQVLRTALIEHLQYHTNVTILTEFSNCLTPEWELFLEENHPYCLIVSQKSLTSHHTKFLNILMLHALQKKINIVLADRLESDVQTIYGYCASGTYSHKAFFERNKERLQQAVHDCVTGQLEDAKPADQILCGYVKHNLYDYSLEVYENLLYLQTLWPEGADIRSIVCAVSCATVLSFYANQQYGAQDCENLNTSSEDDSVKRSKNALTLLEAADLCRMRCLTLIFQKQLPLSQRAKCRKITFDYKFSLIFPFKTLLKTSESIILKQLRFMKYWKVNLVGLPDLTDDILWENILYYYEVEHPNGLNLRMGDTMKQKYVQLWNTILTLTKIEDAGGPFPVRTISRSFLGQRDEESPRVSPGSKQEIHQSGLIPLKSEIVEDFAGDILSELSFLSSDDPRVSALSTREFDECGLWDNFKPLSEFEITQFICDENKSEKIEEGTLCPPENSTSSKTNGEKDIEEDQKRQSPEGEKNEEERWNNLSLSIEKQMRKNLNSDVKSVEGFLQSCSAKSVKYAAEMAELDSCFNIWMECCLKPEVELKCIAILINFMNRIHIIHEKYSEQLQSTHRQKLAQYLKYIGFGNVAHSLHDQVMESGTEEDTSQYAVPMGAARFQLTYMGPYLLRDERSDPDPRVQHFIPDTWQRELLDIVDNNESAVIVAPTSSGKTYASYYCMEKILRESKEGVIVYVAPTKALVNQVRRTVYDSLTKVVPEGQVLCGVFTRDNTHDVLNCRILVTVPQCLEILLLAPHYQEWAKRMRYAIFDEVHCLGGEIGAEVWEHLLVMIRCPFLALSATISNPEHLTEWLMLTKKYWQQVESTMHHTGPLQNITGGPKEQAKEVKHKTSHIVRLVWHKERFNDIEKYVCLIKGHDIVIEHYHPCAALTVNHIKKCGIPSDLGLSPRESILLYDAMARTWPEWPRKQELEPEEFHCFKNKLVIKKADVKKYEEELKKEIICWVEVDPSKVKQLLNCFKFQDEEFEYNAMTQSIMLAALVEKLQVIDRLPAIFFHFNIREVEGLSSFLFHNLARKEIILNSKKKKNLDKDVWKEMKLQKLKNALSSDLDSDAKLQRELIWISEMSEIDSYTETNTGDSLHSSYADDISVDDETLMKILNELMGTRQGYKLHDLLQRGIGFHHGSLEHKEREFVEVLFRQNYIKVVIATSSLALGINMPCKSVAFIEDSCFLDALSFRQMSGRAGRRGEDLVGNVFFYSIPLPKVERLLKSNVPKLKGHFPLSVTFILRLMLLVAKADDKEDAKARAMSALEHSLMSFKNPKAKRIIKLYFICSLQLLVREGYLNQGCIPIGFSGFVSSLHYHEPANFVFVYLLKKGLFHKLCVPENNHGPKRFSENVMENLLLVLASLFGRKFLPPYVQNHTAKFSSNIFIDTLPKECSGMIEEYNTRIKTNFVSFLAMISKQADKSKECQLPLSKIDFSDRGWEKSELVFHLMPGTDSRNAVNPFACLSNITDQDLVGMYFLKDAVFRTIDVNVNKIPLHFSDKYFPTGGKCCLNAYLLDFYRHGSLYALTVDNRLRMGDAFHSVKDFIFVLQTIRTFLSGLGYDEDDNVLLAFEQLLDTFKKLLW